MNQITKKTINATFRSGGDEALVVAAECGKDDVVAVLGAGEALDQRARLHVP